MVALTQQLVNFIDTFDETAVPLPAYRLATTGIIDCIGCMYAGANEPLVQILARHFQGSSTSTSNTPIPVPFLDGFYRHADAACLWGATSHALDYDDVAMSAHPSTVLMPSVMTAGWALACSGRQVLNAYIIGYEIWAECYYREVDPYHLKGWHPTAVFGTIAAAGALAYLYQLDQRTTTMAMGIAASLAGGLVANFGTMTKPFHAGRAAANAIEAIELARLGMTSCEDVLEHKAGFLQAISPHGQFERDKPVTIGRPWRIVESGLNIKRYPVCYSSHRIIDGALALAQKHGITIENITSIDATVGRAQASMLRNARPATRLEAKFSLEFAIAAALTAGKVGLSELSDPFVQQTQLQAFYAKIQVHAVDDPDPADPAFSVTDRLTITLQNGQVLDTGEIRYPTGHAQLPLTQQQLQEKFLDCLLATKAAAIDTDTAACHTIGQSAANRLYHNLDNLATLQNIRTLFTH